MYKNISPVQSINELQFVEKHHPGVYFVPLNLDTLLHCELYEKRFLNPVFYLDSNFHIESSKDSENFTDLIPSISHILAIQSEFIAYLRFYYYQIIYINSLIRRIIEKDNINSIHVSGWHLNKSVPLTDANYFTSRIVENIFGDLVKSIVTQNNKQLSYVNNYSINEVQNTQVLINSFGYNFSRLTKALNRKNITTSSLVFGSLSYKQRMVLCLRGRKSVKFAEKCETTTKDSIDLSSVILEDKCKEELINERIKELIPYFETQLNKCRILDSFIENNRPVLTASYSMRGIDGYLLEKSMQMNIPAIGISHGTVAPAFNENDKIYKKIISEAVFTGSCTHIAVQSKITQDALRTLEVRGEPILTGNLIFAETKQKETKFILYAVTLKDFFGMQFFGVEMYYEFIENLNCLNLLQKKTKIPVIVQLHPSAKKSKEKLQRLFPMLKFSVKCVSDCLKSSILTISYSSTVIEDSLHSQVPVILFDQWSRYQHCHAETEPSIENKAMYYVQSIEKLILAVQTICSSKNIEFSEYIFAGKSSTNFDSLIKKIL
jgi:hypothetical protein